MNSKYSRRRSKTSIQPWWFIPAINAIIFSHGAIVQSSNGSVVAEKKYFSSISEYKWRVGIQHLTQVKWQKASIWTIALWLILLFYSLSCKVHNISSAHLPIDEVQGCDWLPLSDDDRVILVNFLPHAHLQETLQATLPFAEERMRVHEIPDRRKFTLFVFLGAQLNLITFTSKIALEFDFIYLVDC